MIHALLTEKKAFKLAIGALPVARVSGHNGLKLQCDISHIAGEAGFR
jgi:hypothetical protein